MTRFLTTRFVAPLLTAGVLSLPAAAFEMGALTDDERSAFRDEVRAYLLENPEVLMEAIEVLERRNQAEAEANDLALVANNQAALFEDGYSHIAGNPEGSVTMVEFVDYRCGYCRKAFPELKALIETDGDIRVIYKEFPILGEDSVTSSRFAIATQIALGEEAYGQVHDALMGLRATPSPEVLARMADDLGLDSAAILAKYDDPEVARRIDENRLLAQRLQISGTPTFIIEDQMLRGYVPLQGMMQIVESVREKSEG